MALIEIVRNYELVQTPDTEVYELTTALLSC